MAYVPHPLPSEKNYGLTPNDLVDLLSQRDPEAELLMVMGIRGRSSHKQGKNEPIVYKLSLKKNRSNSVIVKVFFTTKSLFVA